MGKSAMIACALLVAGCGRLGFPTAGGGSNISDGGDDDPRVDSRVDGAAMARCSGTTPTCRLVFTTSQTFTGALGGLVGADALCQQAAAGLPGTYMAWLSDSAGTPITRFTHSTVPYVLVDGTVIANDWTQLTSGTILHALDESETGGPPGQDDSNSGCGQPAGTTIVWTSTRSDGTDVPATDCSSWTSASGFSQWGRDDLTSPQWSAYCSSGTCAWHAPLFCFQQ